MIKKRKREELYDKFRQGAIPSGADFADFIRSQLNLLDDGIDIADDPNDPICFRAHGEEENILDFSNTNDEKRWRISGRSEDGTKEGLNIKADDNSKLYVERATGNVGISTDLPEAKLHIKQTGADDALRIDDEGQDMTPLIVTSEGNVGIGIGAGDERPTAKLHVNSPGVGDAFRVDDTSQDTTPFIIDEDGNVGIGCDSPKSKLTILGGGVSIGENRAVGTNNLFVKGDIEIQGNIVVSGGPGMGGLEIEGPIQATTKDLYIKDNVYIVDNPDQDGSDGNLNVKGDTTLGTYTSVPGNYNVVSINGKLQSGGNPTSGEEQYELEINDILTVNRNISAPGDKEQVNINGNTVLGRTVSDKIVLNGAVSSDVGDVRINDNVMIEGNIEVTGAAILNADRVDGKHAGDFASSVHSHANYSLTNHTHANYSLTNHTHDYAPSAHEHEYLRTGNYALVLQGDRNLVLYDGQWTPSRAVWATMTNFSDMNQKKDIQIITNPINKLKALRGIHFYWKEETMGEGRQTGVIAQEVEKDFPELVTTINGSKLVNYGGLVPVLIEAIKEQQSMIDDLQKKVEQLMTKT